MNLWITTGCLFLMNIAQMGLYHLQEKRIDELEKQLAILTESIP